MKIFKTFVKKTKKETGRVYDLQQAAVEKAGRAQIQKLVDKGLGLPIFML